MFSVDWVVESAKRAQLKSSAAALFSVPVQVVHPLSENVDLSNVIKQCALILQPYKPAIIANLDGIYVGEFEILDVRDINAIFFEGAIYVSNIQDNEQDMVDDIIHECAHLIEDIAQEHLYSDGALKKEFLQKRKQLFDLLKTQDLVPEDSNGSEFMNIDFSPEFDKYLHSGVGYPVLEQLTYDLFISPYSITSLREYYALGFEEYYLSDDPTNLKRVSPVLYKKISKMDEIVT